LTPTTPLLQGANELPVQASLTHGKPYMFSTSCLSLNYYSDLKRTKEFQALENVRPTLQNKPSGLRPDWHHTVSSKPSSSKPSAHHQPSSSAHHRTSSPSTFVSPTPSARHQLMLSTHHRTSSSSTLVSPTISSFSPLESDHASTLVAMSPSSSLTKHYSPPFYGDLVPLTDTNVENGHPSAEVSLFYLSSYLNSPARPFIPSHSLCRVPIRTRKAIERRLD
jgi:hypothetical protein